MSKPTNFIGSSTEGISVARALRRGLEHEAETLLWHEGVFSLGEYLKRKSENHAKDRGRGKERTEVHVRKQERESDQKEDRARYDREDIANQGRCVDALEAERKSENKGVKCANEEIADNA
jgi:hypothetical protein